MKVLVGTEADVKEQSKDSPSFSWDSSRKQQKGFFCRSQGREATPNTEHQGVGKDLRVRKGLRLNAQRSVYNERCSGQGYQVRKTQGARARKDKLCPLC